MIGIGTTLNQRFLLEKELGRGGMGAVYSATDQVLQRTVAIKVLKEQSRRGGRASGSASRPRSPPGSLHENVVRIYDFGEADGTYYLVMEEVDGTSYVRRWKQIPLAERLRILAQVAEALDYAHHQGVIHRDVKPANVLLTAGRPAKLSDFGLSLMAEQDDEAGDDPGHAALHEPRAGQGQAARLPDRPVFAGGDALRVGHRAPCRSRARRVGDGASTRAPRRRRPASRNPAISPALERLILGAAGQEPRGPARPAARSSPRPCERRSSELRAREPAGPAQPAAPGPAPAPSRPRPALDLAALAGLEEEASRRGRAAAAAGAGRATGRGRSRSRPRTGRSAARRRRRPGRLAPGPADAPRPSWPSRSMLSADERYLDGHYLAYLLVGSRRQGVPRSAGRSTAATPTGRG